MEVFKILASLVIGLLGGYFLWRGKKTDNIKMMLAGAVLTILSYFAFSGGGDDEASKAVIKTMMPQGTEQQQ